MKSTDRMLQVAAVLEKAAAYIDNMEREKIAKQTQEARAKATKLAERLADTMGEPVTDDLVEKLSGADGELKEVLEKLSGGDTVDYMGGPKEDTKTASVLGGMGPAEQGLMSWLTT